MAQCGGRAVSRSVPFGPGGARGDSSRRPRDAPVAHAHRNNFRRVRVSRWARGRNRESGAGYPTSPGRSHGAPRGPGRRDLQESALVSVDHALRESSAITDGSATRTPETRGLHGLLQAAYALLIALWPWYGSDGPSRTRTGKAPESPGSRLRDFNGTLLSRGARDNQGPRTAALASITIRLERSDWFHLLHSGQPMGFPAPARFAEVDGPEREEPLHPTDFAGRRITCDRVRRIAINGTPGHRSLWRR